MVVTNLLKFQTHVIFPCCVFVELGRGFESARFRALCSLNTQSQFDPILYNCSMTIYNFACANLTYH